MRHPVLFILTGILCCSAISSPVAAQSGDAAAFIASLGRRAKEQVVPGGSAEQIRFKRYVAEWGRANGLSADAAEKRLDAWATKHEKGSDSYLSGLALLYRKDFTAAAERMNESVTEKANKINELQNTEAGKDEALKLLLQAIRQLQLIGNALYLDYDFVNAVATYRQALGYLPKSSPPELAITLLLDVGQAYSEIGTRVGPTEAREMFNNAETSFRKALENVDQAAHSALWAEAQNSLGAALALSGLARKDSTGNQKLKSGMAAFTAALSVYKRETDPYKWAKTQNNIGATKTELALRKGGEEGVKLLREAAAAYEAALEVRSFENARLEWAQTHNNLAAVYFYLKEWPKVAQSYSNVLKVFPGNRTAYQLASEIYQKQLFNFERAYELNANWLEKKPDDLMEQVKLVEKKFTTGRFQECQQAIAEFIASEDYSALVYILMDILGVVNQIALRQPEEVSPFLTDLIERLEAQPQSFSLDLNLNDLKHFVAEREEVASHREWLAHFLTAFDARERDEVVAKLKETSTGFQSLANN